MLKIMQYSGSIKKCVLQGFQTTDPGIDNKYSPFNGVQGDGNDLQTCLQREDVANENHVRVRYLLLIVLPTPNETKVSKSRQ